MLRRAPVLVVAIGSMLLAGLAFSVLSGQGPEPSAATSPALIDPSIPGDGAPTPRSPDVTGSAPPSPSATDVASAPCGQVIEATEPSGTSKASLVAVSGPGGLTVYDIASDSLNMLIPEYASHISPRFRTPRLVTFVDARRAAPGGNALLEVDVATGAVTELLRFAHVVQGFDWNADGTRLAYMVATGTETRIGPHALCLFDSRSGETTLLREVRRPFGTSVSQWEETAVKWSPNDRHILAIETSTRPSVFVVDLVGRDVVEPRGGTFGRWLSANRVLFQAEGRTSEDPGAWFTVSLPDGRSAPFEMPAGYRPALSPTGRYIAFDDGARVPTTYVFDVEKGTTRELAAGSLAPVWLGGEVVAASAAVRCTRDYFCPTPWMTSGGTLGIDLGTGEVTPLVLPTTLAGINWFGVVDVSLPPADP